MYLLCYLAPEDLALDRTLVRQRVFDAVRAGEPVPPIPGSTTRITVQLRAEDYELLEPVSLAARISSGRAFGAYAAAARRALAATASARPEISGMRPEQTAALDEILPGLVAGRIVISELGTGVGKSRIIGASAAHLIDELRAGRRPPPPAAVTTGSLSARRGADRAQAAAEENAEGDLVIVAAPTVANIAHLLREFATLGRADVRVAVLLGRQQFVSATRLGLLLDSLPSPAISAWMASGMPPRSDTGRSIAAVQAGICGLTECLRSIDPGFPVADVALSREEEESDSAVYDAHRAVARHADVAFTTHAMVCLDALNLASEDRDRTLPPLLALIVDEAHRLEDAQAGVLSSGLHLSLLRAALQDRNRWSGTAAAVEKAKSAAQALFLALQGLGDDVTLSASGANGANARIRGLAAALHSALKEAAKAKRGTPADGRPSGIYGESLRCLQQIASPQSTVHVRLSPVKRFPSLVVGPATVAPFLAARWATTPAVLLTSGTLLLPTLQGLSHASITTSLALPGERILRCKPIHPNWLTHSPVVYLPTPADAARLHPPRSEDPSSMDAWGSAQADIIRKVADSAAGGTLVLCSGYERIAAIARALAPLGSRLIVQERKTTPLSACDALFRTHGDRPVWIATGGAWTGLDISDAGKDPADDLLLTDLVITATPFGMAHTSTHLSRVARMGFLTEKRSALMMLRQGLGRLIRRQGLLHRRLWLLDGRYANPKSASLMSEVKGLMQTFAKREPLPPISDAA